MVTTRRSGQRQGSADNTEDLGPTTSYSQEAPAAGHARGRGRSAARGRGRGRGKGLDPVVEDTAQNAELYDSQADLAAPASQPQEGEGKGGHMAEAATFAGDEAAAAFPKPATSQDGELLNVCNSGNDDSSDRQDESEPSDTDDDAIFGSNVMDNLASSLRAALYARAGTRNPSPSPPPRNPGEQPPREKLGLECDPNIILWKPDVKAPEVVSARQRVAPGVGASKEKGLTKQLLAPPRSKAAEGPSKSEATKRWFELPAPKITNELKQELRLLRLRGAYDPKRFYKSFDETKFPKNFQIGTVVDNPQDFYSSRLTARERGASITQELLADPAVEAVRRKRYAKLQQEATRHQKVKKRKSDLVRASPKPKRPKH